MWGGSTVGLGPQGGWPYPVLTTLLWLTMASVVNSQLTTNYRVATTTIFPRTTYRRTVYTAGTSFKTFIQGSSTYYPPNTGPATARPTPLPTVYTPFTNPPLRPTQSTVVGNLTGDNICPRDVIETRYVWSPLTFDCVRREYHYCWECQGCPLYNATHCLKLIDGKCQADVYQYQPVTVQLLECCKGYEAVGTQCLEAVECQNNNGGCQHICRSNKQSGKHCECYTGYQFVNSDCIDFDECTRQKGGCSDDCQNTIGSFYCTCPPGRQLVTPLRCEDLKPCEQRNGGCEHNCIPRDGTHYCTCNEGFQLIEGRECRDIDECAKNNPCKHKCENRIGSYICRCPDGQYLLPDNSTCSGNGALAPLTQKNVLMIGTLAGVGALLLIVALVWIICCYMSGCYCYREKEKRKKRRRRRKKRKEDVEAIVVHYKNGENKDDDPPGYSNRPPYYDNEYNTHARTPNGMAAKEEVAGDIHIIPDFD